MDPETEEAKLIANDPESDENELRMNVQTTEELAPAQADMPAERANTPTVETAPPPEESQSDANAQQVNAAPVTPMRSECKCEYLNR